MSSHHGEARELSGDVLSKVARAREGERGRRRKKGNSEGGWLMRIESWGRFSVYVARIRNFGAPNHIQYHWVRLSTHTHTPPRTGARARTHIDKSGASFGEKKNGYVFSICNSVTPRSRRGAHAMYPTRNSPKVCPGSIKNTDCPRGRAPSK